MGNDYDALVIKSYKTDNERTIAQRVLEIITVIAPDADLSNIAPGDSFRDQMELDSMDFLDIVMELRKRYKVEVPKGEYRELASLDSSVKYLMPKMFRNGDA